MRLALTAAFVIFGSVSAHSAPWRSEFYTINPGTFHTAVQFDASDDYALVVRCHEETGEFDLYVESPFDWEVGASYAPEVPAVVTIDGFAVTDVKFYFDDKQMFEGIVADGTAPYFGQLLDRMVKAENEIRIDYFNRSATFSVEGIEDAMMTLADYCL